MTRVLVPALVALLAGCGDRTVRGSGTDEGEDSGQTGPDETGDTGPDETSGPVLDVGDRPDAGDQIDFLFVIDNSPSMQEEQRNVARNLRAFWEEIVALESWEGDPGALLHNDMHMMVTTTDLGGPACPAVDGYSPAMGGPITQGCNGRIDEFSDDALDLSEACTQACPNDVVPDGDFIAFDGEGGSNVPDDDIGSALACLGAQGIVGCEYGQPLEAMLRALDPNAPWNQGPDPFLREESDLVIVLVTDQPDCSVADPAVFEDTALMNVHPDTGQPEPSHAICWNALAECQDKQQDGSWADCSPSAAGVHPVERYVERLRDELVFDENRTVVMLAALGVPLVTHHSEQPPFVPTAGGIFDLVYRDWVDGPWPSGDLLPGQGPSAAHEQWRHGIGPGCIGDDGQGEFVGHATPPVRVNEVCQALDGDEFPDVRCCIESVCDLEFSQLARCLMPIGVCPWGMGQDGERCIPPG